MGKVANRGSAVTSRRRYPKASTGMGGRKGRGPNKVSLPPPSQSLVLDEDSGFGDQSMDSESSLHTAPPTTIAASTAPNLPSVLPSLTMVPQTKLLLVSLLQGGGVAQGTPTSQKNQANIVVGAYPPSTQPTFSNGTNQIGSTHGTVTSIGAEKEWNTSHSVRPLVAAATLSHGGSSVSDVVSELPAASTTTFPSTCPPTGPVALGNTGHKVIKSEVGSKRVHVDLAGDEAQELPASKGGPSTPPIPPLISFRDVSLLSSIQSFQGNGCTTTTPLVCVENASQRCNRSNKAIRQAITTGPPSLTAQLSSVSSDGQVELMLTSQPEEQHRARYKTEGSRGAVKDRSGAGHPTVKLVGYNKPASLQVFVGCDSGKSGPHMFYQVCRVTGKNSAPCKERRIDGTAVIEAPLDLDSDMTMSCDCVGILKERNVDVEHRFKAIASRGRKKSTKCRLVFRTTIVLDNGVEETLQVVSQPIACTQPPGVPEISRKSLSKCSVSGKEELFIFGKNFLKDTVVTFQENGAKDLPIWEVHVSPDKESLQPIHLIVTVPQYYNLSINEEVTVQMVVSSGGKVSEPHTLTYVPLVTKKELPPPEPKDDKRLPKGVSPSALQLNLQYAETRTLPVLVSEAKKSTKLPSSPIMQSQENSAGTQEQAVPQQSVNGSQLPLNPVSTVSHAHNVAILTPNEKASVSTPQLTKSDTNSQQSNTAQKDLEVKEEEIYVDEEIFVNEEGSKVALQKDGVRSNVSLESLVEMLKIVPSLPTGSNLHASVLQLIEELVKSMKENISSNGEPAKAPKPSPEKVNPVGAVSARRLSGLVTTPAKQSLSNLLSGKLQKPATVNSLVPVIPANASLTSTSTSATVSSGITPTVSLLPFTVFSSVPSIQTVSSSPRVARVAPIPSMAPVAPTTVVPGLARTVRVCVTEAPNISPEPLKKKMREEIIPMDYYVQGQGIASTIPTAVVSQPSEVANYRNIATHQKLVVSQCDTLPSPICTNTVNTSNRINSSPPQVILNSAVQNTAVINQVMDVESPICPSQQTVYQPISQSMIQSFNVSSTQQVSQTLPMDMTPTIMQTQAQICPSTQYSPQHGNQCGISAEAKIGSHGQQQQQSAMPVSVSDPLLSQSTEMCQLLPTRVVVATATTAQGPMITSGPVATMALTRSDPLLSQSSPVAPLQLESNTGPAVTQSQQTQNANQASMQNEVSSAINLSETELLNYFDPNCFDNV